MLDVYFCSMPQSQERQDIADRMLDLWLKVPMCHVHLLNPAVVGCSPQDFNRERRIYADSRNVDRFYILTDDDCELVSESMVWRALDTLEKYWEFAILSAYPSNATINPWQPEIYPPVVDGYVEEHVSVGGIRFCRTGCMEPKQWPRSKGPGYDAEHCQKLRELGWRSGYAKQARMFHHGEGKTELWNQDSLVHSRNVTA